MSDIQPKESDLNGFGEWEIGWALHRNEMNDLQELYAKAHAAQLARNIEAEMGARPVTLYDQFGRPVYVPSSAGKIGDKITVKRPHKFKEPT